MDYLCELYINLMIMHFYLFKEKPIIQSMYRSTKGTRLLHWIQVSTM